MCLFVHFNLTQTLQAFVPITWAWLQRFIFSKSCHIQIASNYAFANYVYVPDCVLIALFILNSCRIGKLCGIIGAEA